jgi:NAD(P)-dependent dehydrogenase (short-subunit alcohol dehydrogenase family)
LKTGANTGIGLETVKALLGSERKYHILLGGRVLDKAMVASEKVLAQSTSGSSVEPFLVDVESDESISKAYKNLASRYPRIDCLVNNAGMSSTTLSVGSTLMTLQVRVLMHVYNRAL